MSQAINNQFNSAYAGNSLVGKGGEMDKQAFLMLMVTQFQYQDPLNPTEDKEFVAQLAQFSSLEQMMNMNTSMEGLVEAQNKQMIIGAATFIGKEVSAQGYGVSVEDGKVSTIHYASDEDIASGSVSIFNASRELVATVKLKPTAAGVNKFEWDGRLGDGTIAPNGVYTIAITAKDANDKTILTDAQVSGRVDAVSTYNGEQFLRLSDGRVVSMANIREIVEAQDKAGNGESSEKDDELVAGSGADTFKWNKDNVGGTDKIINFDKTQDVIDLSALELDAKDLRMSTKDNSTTIKIYNDKDLIQTIVLDKVALTQEEFDTALASNSSFIRLKAESVNPLD